MTSAAAAAGRIVVIGRGLLSSSAARHLTEAGADVTVVGPSEPAQRSTHTGVFGSHYDSGRIVRGTDQHSLYSTLAIRSIRKFEALERATGIGFFHPVGHVSVSPMPEYVRDLESAAVRHKLDVSTFDLSKRSAQETLAAFPYLHFDSISAGIHEVATGGWIDPRRFIEAQCRAVELSGGRVVDAQALRIERANYDLVVETTDGDIPTDRVLIATGAFATQATLLPRPVELSVHEHTVVFGVCSPSQAATLSDMPTVIYKRSNEFMDSVYLMPPIRYPDGRMLVKIGQSSGRVMADPETQLVPWFQGNGDPEIADWLGTELQALLPDMDFAETFSESCVTTSSPSSRPYIDTFPDGRTHMLLAGNGQVAKSADELGRIAAYRLIKGRTPPQYRDVGFGVRWADEVGYEPAIDLTDDGLTTR